MIIIYKSDDNSIVGNINGRQDKDRVLSNYTYPVEIAEIPVEIFKKLRFFGPPQYYNPETNDIQDEPVL